MKTFVILVSLCALATASPVSPFSEDEYESSEMMFDEDEYTATEDVQDALQCIGQSYLDKGADFTTDDILECVPESRAENEDDGVNGNTNYMNFVVKAKSSSESFVIRSSHLEWGKWTQNNRDVKNIDNLQIKYTKPAMFRASGRKMSPAGTEGGFTIYKKSIAIAKVSFNVPSKGKNVFGIKHYNRDFECTSKGFSKSGSPTVKIECGSTSHSETEDSYVENVADSVVPSIVRDGQYYHIFFPKIAEESEAVF